MEVCTEEFARLTRTLTDVRCDGNPVVTFTSPFDLQNWTMPIMEWLAIAGAIAALVHAVRWYRREHDASNLVVWLTGVIALTLIEPTSYFPQWFGLEDALGLTFVHNQFSVNFLYNRVPLYIVACYPTFLYISFILVQRTGIFRRYHAVVGAASVAMVYHFLWEIVDTLGQQWKWWVWNTELGTSTPALNVVPLLNIQVFTIIMPFGVALVPLLLSQRRRGGWFVVRDVAINSVAVWPLIFVSALPGTLVDLFGGSLEVGRAVQAWGWIALAIGVGAYAYVGAFRARSADPSVVPDAVRRDYLALVWCVAYLIATAAFWIAALPEYFDAVGNVTADGGQTGSFPYAVFAYVGSIVVIAASYLRTTGRRASAPRADELVAA